MTTLTNKIHFLIKNQSTLNKYFISLLNTHDVATIEKTWSNEIETEYDMWIHMIHDNPGDNFK